MPETKDSPERAIDAHLNPVTLLLSRAGKVNYTRVLCIYTESCCTEYHAIRALLALWSVADTALRYRVDLYIHDTHPLLPSPLYSSQFRIASSHVQNADWLTLRVKQRETATNRGRYCCCCNSKTTRYTGGHLPERVSHVVYFDAPPPLSNSTTAAGQREVEQVRERGFCQRLRGARQQLEGAHTIHG